MIKLEDWQVGAIENYYDISVGIKDILGDKVNEDLELTILIENYKIAKESLVNGLLKRVEE